MSSSSRPAARDSIEVYEEVIRSFEAAQAKLRQRRSTASAHVVVHLDRSLELNERTLESLRHARAMASRRLAAESWAKAG